jgi:hypothetical protein
MANLLTRDDEKEGTPRLEKTTLIRELQMLSQVKGIQKAGMPRIERRLVSHSPSPGCPVLLHGEEWREATAA